MKCSLRLFIFSFSLIIIIEHWPIDGKHVEEPKARDKCKDAEKIFRRKACFEAGHAVTFLFGGEYACCLNATDAELLSLGASAFWRKDRGFCGRGACEKCDKQTQECVVYGDEDIFCCPKGYQIME